MSWSGAALRLVSGPALSRFALLISLYILVIASMQRAGRPSQELNQCRVNLKLIGIAMEMYSTDHAGHYAKSLNVLTPLYLKQVPSCPSATRDSYFEACRTEFAPHGFTIHCSGRNHAEAGLPANQPIYQVVQVHQH